MVYIYLNLVTLNSYPYKIFNWNYCGGCMCNNGKCTNTECTCKDCRCDEENQCCWYQI